MPRRIRAGAITTLVAVGAIAGATPGSAMVSSFDFSTPAVAPAALQPADPAVAANSSGDQILAFTGRTAGGFAVFVRARRRTGGPWGTPTRVSALSGTRPLRPTVGVGTNGTAVVLWRASGGAVVSALRPGSAGPWVRLPVASDGVGFVSPDVALGPATATAAWGEGSGARWRARVATLDVSSRQWTVGPRLDVGGPPALAVGASADVSATWSAATGSATPESVRASLRPSGATAWRPATLLSTGGEGPATDTAANGAAIVAWKETATPTLRASVLTAGASAWSSPEEIGEGSLPVPEVAINTAGDAVMTWLAPDGRALDMRRRSGDDETWGPRIRLDEVGLIGAYGAPIALDDLGNAFIIWIDPEGPGVATLYGWVGPGPTPVPLRALSLSVGGNVERVSLAADGRGDALVASTRSLAEGPPLNRDVAAVPLRRVWCAEPPPEPSFLPPGTITLSASQLRINQRISAAAVRRANAVEAWLDERVRTRDLCGGGIVASTLGAGVAAGPAMTSRSISPANPRPLDIAPAKPDPDANFTLSTTQLRINQRIASRAVRQANALTNRLDRGLTGGDLAPGAITPEKLALTIALTHALPAPTPPPSRTVLPPAKTDPDANFTLSAAQLKINQRISQAAIRRVNELRVRLATGLTASDLRSSTITASNLSPGWVSTP